MFSHVTHTYSHTTLPVGHVFLKCPCMSSCWGNVFHFPKNVLMRMIMKYDRQIRVQWGETGQCGASVLNTSQNQLVQCNIILLTDHVFLMNLRDDGPCVTVDEVVVFSLGLFFTLCSVICGIPVSLTQAHSEVAMCACYCQNEFVSQAPKMNLTETQNSMGTARMWCF